MDIVQIKIKNFRTIKFAKIVPQKCNVFLGPNNIGKTTILEALNLVLNPEVTYRTHIINENDFYQRCYQLAGSKGDMRPKNIYIELVLSDLKIEDEDKFKDQLVPWDPNKRKVIESTREGEDPFETAQSAIRVFFEAWYDSEDDDFYYGTYFLRAKGIKRENCSNFSREHKRHIGFLIYKNTRFFTRPITLEPANLFTRLLQSQNVTPKNFEETFNSLSGALDQMIEEPDFQSILKSYKSELEMFMPLSFSNEGTLSFDLTDGTRSQLKETAQLYIQDKCSLPLQKMGAGTQSLAILAILTLIMRRRGRGILALEEPESFLFPHAQRRVIDECINLSNQMFVTTHSPYILERIPVEGVGRVVRKKNDILKWQQLSFNNVKQINLYSQRVRESFSEALIGKAVVIVEGDSDKWWLYGGGRILHKKSWNNQCIEALELQGISVISADSNGDIIKVGKFFTDAGLEVFCLFDSSSEAFLSELLSASLFSIILRQKGLEEILSEQLPMDMLIKLLTEAPHSKTPLKTLQEITALTENVVRAECKNMLISNKGSHSLHEWLIAQLNEHTLPSTLGDIICIVSGYYNQSSLGGLITLLR